MLILQAVNYIHPNADLLFADVDIVINRHEKVALIGNNGAGKSTLLKIMAGLANPANGIVKSSSSPYYIPQVFGRFNNCNIAQALQVEKKLQSLKEIIAGKITNEKPGIAG